MGGTPNKPKRHQTTTRQIGSDNKKNIPKNEKELKSLLGAIQYLSKYIKNLSAQTDILRKLPKKQNEWIWTEEHTEAFNNLQVQRD